MSLDEADASAEPSPEERHAHVVHPRSYGRSQRWGSWSIPRRIRGYIQTYGQGRTCAAPGCDTTLSRYNKAALCWRHAKQARLFVVTGDRERLDYPRAEDTRSPAPCDPSRGGRCCGSTTRGITFGPARSTPATRRTASRLRDGTSASG